MIENQSIEIVPKQEALDQKPPADRSDLFVLECSFMARVIEFIANQIRRMIPAYGRSLIPCAILIPVNDSRRHPCL